MGLSAAFSLVYNTSIIVYKTCIENTTGGVVRMGMATREMAKALTVYIQTFKLFGADIRYETVDGVLKGLVELPVEQLAADEFALRLEFYGSDSKGGSAGGSAMRLIHGTGGIVREMHPTDGHDSTTSAACRADGHDC
jgi:hypothetical protein